MEGPIHPAPPGEHIEEIAKRFYKHMHDGVHQPRQDSLTKADDGQHRQLAVKRVRGLGTPDGEMSNLVHDEVQGGDEVVLSVPFGDVVLEYTYRPLVQAMLLHADDSEASFPLRGQVREDLAALTDGTLRPGPSAG
ncbi:hypothetical protein [Arthrobacter sp. TB 26]|uniref:hypothetical protein n=1 Tax=Arthrobacter sp. TB 26 TaxID=494420 RepID=UPI000416D1A0|nr:hypothetical protein [Arthrobacter sp. TB 26]